MVQCPDGTPPPCAAAAPVRGPAPAANSVAVLYFDIQSRDSGDVYLADGLTEEIITRLSGIERLTVRSRHLVRRYRGLALDNPSAIARALNVAYLVTGSVRRAGDRVRITAELIRASSGTQVWGLPMDQSGSDVFAIQETVAREVATGIVGRLLPAERGAIAARVTRDPVAYDHFLRGNYFLGLRSDVSLAQAVRQYEAAARADPSFTDAVARIGYTYATTLDNEYNVGLTRDSLVARGVAAAERAVAMDSNSSDAWLALAYIREAQYPRTLAGAEDAFRRALALNPRSAEAHHQYGDYLARTGESAMSIEEDRRALALEPGRAATYIQLMNQAFASGRMEDAVRFSDSVLAFNPGSVGTRLWRYLLFVGLGDSAAQQRVLAELRAVAPGGGTLVELHAAAMRGDTAARRRFVELPRVPPAPTAPGTQLRGIYTSIALLALGERDAALTALERATPRGAVLHWFMQARVLEPLRGEPRFQRVLDESRRDAR